MAISIARTKEKQQPENTAQKLEQETVLKYANEPGYQVEKDESGQISRIYKEQEYAEQADKRDERQSRYSTYRPVEYVKENGKWQRIERSIVKTADSKDWNQYRPFESNVRTYDFKAQQYSQQTKSGKYDEVNTTGSGDFDLATGKQLSGWSSKVEKPVTAEERDEMIRKQSPEYKKAEAQRRYDEAYGEYNKTKGEQERYVDEETGKVYTSARAKGVEGMMRTTAGQIEQERRSSLKSQRDEIDMNQVYEEQMQKQIDSFEEKERFGKAEELRQADIDQRTSKVESPLPAGSYDISDTNEQLGGGQTLQESATQYGVDLKEYPTLLERDEQRKQTKEEYDLLIKEDAERKWYDRLYGKVDVGLLGAVPFVGGYIAGALPGGKTRADVKEEAQIKQKYDVLPDEEFYDVRTVQALGQSEDLRDQLQLDITKKRDEYQDELQELSSAGVSEINQLKNQYQDKLQQYADEGKSQEFLDMQSSIFNLKLQQLALSRETEIDKLQEQKSEKFNLDLEKMGISTNEQVAELYADLTKDIEADTFSFSNKRRLEELKTAPEKKWYEPFSSSSIKTNYVEKAIEVQEKLKSGEITLKEAKYELNLRKGLAFELLGKGFTKEEILNMPAVEIAEKANYGIVEFKVSPLLLGVTPAAATGSAVSYAKTLEFIPFSGVKATSFSAGLTKAVIGTKVVTSGFNKAADVMANQYQGKVSDLEIQQGIKYAEMKAKEDELR